MTERHFKSYPPFGPEAEQIDLEELKTWVLENNDDLLVINKPGWIVCHPSKAGPWSSLVGACREWTGMDPLHLVARLDRETSGLVVFAKNKSTARFAQMAFQERAVKKTYLALLCGTLQEPADVCQHLARDLNSPVYVKQAVRKSNSSQSARTVFIPLAHGGGYTLARVEPVTGRKHQIRAHAEWLGHSIVGDKIYGPDASLFLEFAEHGWTPRLEAALPMRRQALHAAELVFNAPGFERTFSAPLAWDMVQFCQEVMGVSP